MWFSVSTGNACSTKIEEEVVPVRLCRGLDGHSARSAWKGGGVQLPTHPPPPTLARGERADAAARDGCAERARRWPDAGSVLVGRMHTQRTWHGSDLDGRRHATGGMGVGRVLLGLGRCSERHITTAAPVAFFLQKLTLFCRTSSGLFYSNRGVLQKLEGFLQGMQLRIGFFARIRFLQNPTFFYRNSRVFAETSRVLQKHTRRSRHHNIKGVLCSAA